MSNDERKIPTYSVIKKYNFKEVTIKKQQLQGTFKEKQRMEI